MKKHWFTIIAILVFAVSTAFAGHDHGGKQKYKSLADKLGAKLNLTEAQKAQVAAIEKTTRDQNAAFFDNASATKKDYMAAKNANDTAKLDSLKPVMESQQAQMKRIHEEQMKKVLEVLTPEQRLRWEQIKAESKAAEKKHH